MSGELYFIIKRGHTIVNVCDDFLSARRSLHAERGGHYIMRGDGAILAYMSSESGSRAPAKIPKELKRQVAIRAGVRKVSQLGQHCEGAKAPSRRPRRKKDS